MPTFIEFEARDRSCEYIAVFFEYNAIIVKSDC